MKWMRSGPADKAMRANVTNAIQHMSQRSWPKAVITKAITAKVKAANYKGDPVGSILFTRLVKHGSYPAIDIPLLSGHVFRCSDPRKKMTALFNPQFQISSPTS